MKLKKKNDLTKLIAVVALSILTTSSVFADCWYNTRRDNGNANVYYDASVAAYSYGSLIDAARNEWSSISTEVKLYHSTSTVNDPDRYYVRDENPNMPLFGGQFIPYIKNAASSHVVAGDDDTWHKCNVVVYHEALSKAGWTTNAHRQAIIMHEMGHTLKLAHPGGGSQRVQAMGNGNASIMLQDQTAGTVSVLTIQPYDEQELKFKWGN